MTEKHKKWIAAGSMLVFFLFVAAIFWFVGKPLIRFLSEPEQFRLWVDDHGFIGQLAFVGMVVLQIFIAIIPGEPLEIGAGYAFGIWEGTLLCILGSVIGSALVFLFVRKCGIKAVEVFFSRERINSLRFLRDAKRLNLLVFIVFFIPGTPKDILSYCVGLTNMKLSTWLLISGFARIPSIITSTIGGDALGLGQHRFAILVFVITIVISLIGLLIYRRILEARKKEAPGTDPAGE